MVAVSRCTRRGRRAPKGLAIFGASGDTGSGHRRMFTTQTTWPPKQACPAVSCSQGLKLPITCFLWTLGALLWLATTLPASEWEAGAGYRSTPLIVPAQGHTGFSLLAPE